MQTRKLGRTDLDLSVIGLGSYAIGGDWYFGWGLQDDEESITAILHGIEKGINWIDTAPIYGCGHSEEIVGKAINGLSSKPIISTKCGHVCDNRGDPVFSLGRENIRIDVERSLKRLQIDVIDLCQIHWPNPEKDVEEAWSVLVELVKEGKIRYIGVSNFDVEQMQRIQSIHPVAFLQPPYSILERGIENRILDYCMQSNIGVIAYSPMQQGLLTGKFSKERLQNLPAKDVRHKMPHFQEPQFSANLELADGLYSIAEKNDCTVAQLAIAWVLRRPEVTAAIVGTRRPSQIKETVLAGDLKISEDAISAINKLIAKRDEALNI
jgi:aryl-alcohol dehydrogenase-like predicted oxidoreductase